MSDGISPMTPEEHDAMKRTMERIANVGAGVTPTYHATESVEEAKAVVEQCMSETELLRRMLDDRGVEWRNNDTIRWASEPHERSTIFDDANGNQVIVTQALSGNLAMSGRVGLTPEQAVEATLGRGECRIETVTTDARDWPNNERCTGCGEFVSVLNPIRPRYCPNCGRKVVGE